MALFHNRAVASALIKVGKLDVSERQTIEGGDGHQFPFMPSAHRYGDKIFEADAFRYFTRLRKQKQLRRTTEQYIHDGPRRKSEWSQRQEDGRGDGDSA